jgi:competence ComEA-like helix-hairpin-helix protein
VRASALRIPDSGPARALACAAIAALALRPLATPAPPEALEPVRTASDCALGLPGSGPACACGALPGDLRLLLGRPIALDRATERDLDALPGIGARRAAAIVRERARGGAFVDASALARVPGLGPATVERLAPLVSASDSPCAEGG